MPTYSYENKTYTLSELRFLFPTVSFPAFPSEADLAPFGVTLVPDLEPTPEEMLAGARAEKLVQLGDAFEHVQQFGHFGSSLGFEVDANERANRDVAGLMENITAVTEFLRTETDDPRGVLTLVKTHDGASYLHAQDAYWRVYDFVEDSICLQLPETDEDFYQSAVGFGTFQQLLTDFPAAKLHETIPNFHNTPDRYRAFLKTLERDPLHRAAQVLSEIGFALARQTEMATLQNALTAGELPLRVTHNDTKLNNVLLDAKTRKALCVIDLDTVMPGSSLYDFGDSIRFGAATAAEDEKDLSKMEMSLDRFRVFTRGYVRACPGLTAKELELLPMGAKTMTMECGVRFLTDYLDGDHYFAVHRDGQNLDRARAQFKLVADMEQKWDEMQKIVKEESR